MKNLMTFDEFLNESTKNDNIITIKKMNDINHTRLEKWMYNEFGDKYEAGLKFLDSPLSKEDFTLDVSKWDKRDVEDLKKYLKSQHYIFEGSVNESLNTEQKHISVLMDYLLNEFDEDAFDTLSNRIAKKLKNSEWEYQDITGSSILQVKEILNKYYAQKKVINDKLLKNPGKKWQDLIDAYNWLNS